MKLTGKCKEDFEKWRLLNHKYTESEVSGAAATIWEYLDESMQYGVYVDFFDSVGIMISILTNVDENELFFRIDGYHMGRFDTRQEARTAAIEKANEIYNN